MKDNQADQLFREAPVPAAVLKNAVPAMLAMLMVLIYNLADTFFIGQTHDALQVAAVSLATPVFLIFMDQILASYVSENGMIFLLICDILYSGGGQND